ncbi:GNAT family N-acetyltransferase [Sphingopyxis sp. MWB1]|uniref:GNAT family N-acetyltransferase n=1 Tax=Sphingopyxis sp. MWB1 TaxID=1537715 RepID=UPI00051A8009|nr:GNAT family N-acetyltransferase [Sphingopyxis sp. MWB1]
MKNISLSIRAYRAADKSLLSSIWYEASRRAHPFLSEERLRQQQRAVEDIYLEQAENWVACIKDHPIAFIGLLGEHVGGLFVTPEAQGRGAGRALIAHALALKGRLSLEVYADNHGARAFYAALGFREISRRDVDDEGLPFANIRLALDRDAPLE